MAFIGRTSEKREPYRSGALAGSGGVASGCVCHLGRRVPRSWLLLSHPSSLPVPLTIQGPHIGFEVLDGKHILLYIWDLCTQCRYPSSHMVLKLQIHTAISCSLLLLPAVRRLVHGDK